MKARRFVSLLLCVFLASPMVAQSIFHSPIRFANNTVREESMANMGATTVGLALFRATNPGAVTYARLNADNSVTLLSASAFVTAIGAADSATAVTLSGTQTLTNKTLTSPVVTTPTGIVKGDVGLGNVDNTSDANKPISTLTQSALDTKAPVSTTATLTGTQTLTNKTLTAPVINSPTGIVKGDVGLGNVDNTSDANKPVSTDQQTALDLKLDDSQATAFGLSLLDDADAAAARSTLVLGTAAIAASSDFATAAQGAKADTAAQVSLLAFSDTNIVISSSNREVVQTGTLTTVRSATMPAASSVPAGTTIGIVDASRTASASNYISVVTTGSDTFVVNDSTTPNPTALRVNSPGGRMTFVSDGASSWREQDTIFVRRVYIPAHTSGNAGTGFFWDTYANGTSITWDSTQKKMRFQASRLDFLPMGSLGESFIQNFNDGFDNAIWFASPEGSADAIRLTVPGHRIALPTDFWNGSQSVQLNPVIRSDNDGVNPYISIFVNGSMSQPAFPFSWPPATAGTESTRLTHQGINMLNNGITNIGMGLAFTGSGAATTINNLGGTGGVFNAAVGGTGLSSYTVGDLVYASGTATLAKLAAVASGNALISSGTGAAPAWGKVTTAHTTGIAASGSNTDISYLMALTKANLAPSIAGTSSPTSGIAFFGSDVQIVRAGVAQAYTDTAGFIVPTAVVTSVLNIAAGSTTFPSITRISDNTTGYTHPSAGNITISVSGTEKTRWTTSGFAIGAAGTAIASAIVGTATLDFGNLAPLAEETLTITVTGATTTSEVAMNFSGSFEPGILVKQCRVSASNTVSVTVLNSGTGTVDPASQTSVRAFVFNH